MMRASSEDSTAVQTAVAGLAATPRKKRLRESVGRDALLFDRRGRSAYDLAALPGLHEYDDAQVLAFP